MDEEAYDYDDVDNTTPPLDLARQRLTAYVTAAGDMEVDFVMVDLGPKEGVAMLSLHTRDIGAVLQALDGEYKSSDALLTNEDWREYQQIPDQGYSHRCWLEHRFHKRMTERMTGEKDDGRPQA